MVIHVECYNAHLPSGITYWTREYEDAFQHVTGRRTDDFDTPDEREQAVQESDADLTIFGYSR